MQTSEGILGDEIDGVGVSGQPVLCAAIAQPATIARRKVRRKVNEMIIMQMYFQPCQEARMYTRRDFGRLALAGLPLSAAMAASSAINGVKVGATTFSF